MFRFTIGFATTLCLVAMWILPACAAADTVPDSLTNAGEFAENIYDHARDGDWPAAAKKLAALRADVVAHNGAKQADTFGALVAKASAAKSTAEYAAVTKPILDEVDNLENVYKK
jgi:hypothetical protein